MNGQSKRDLHWDLARNGSREAAALRPFSPAHGRSTEVIVIADIKCPSLLANDGTGKRGTESSSLPALSLLQSGLRAFS